MGSGRSSGDRWLDDSVGRWPNESDHDSGEGRRARRPRWISGEPPVTPPVRDDADWLHPTGYGQDPAEFDVADYRDRLLSGPAAELYGVSSGRAPEEDPLADTGAFTAFAERAFNAESPVEHSGPALPRQASEEYEEGSGLVRPYFRTRGRTRPTYDLALEALVSTSERGRDLDRVRVPEHRSICDLCLDTRSVAEVAALLRLPLGVVRVLVGDVAGLGLVLVHSAQSAVGDRPSIEFMERVLSGLRRI
ncbi:Protein of unknown function [Amycolatopsis arida]|uniref:DUF742 domain-containing protein n=1 Tax=Amycolatopsis arida TaxID=587909 RepID=A0A1I5QQ47_9PSEU|nr:DUF742 domain-containing protein [Amycolatopsis arida]TDX98917.1 uncharacterized protein DUF742 [Amycolatopsis arida]SFP48187.1 Protein of unknown function [Amycolatopsis arida]